MQLRPENPGIFISNEYFDFLYERNQRNFNGSEHHQKNDTKKSIDSLKFKPHTIYVRLRLKQPNYLPEMKRK